MAEWALKLGSAAATLLVLAGSFAYAATHVKNPNAPLQPPVAESATAQPVAAVPASTAIPSLVGTRRGGQPRAGATPAPRLTLQPGVQSADLPEVTFTHTS
jgi:hypothetical protein